MTACTEKLASVPTAMAASPSHQRRGISTARLMAMVATDITSGVAVSCTARG